MKIRSEAPAPNAYDAARGEQFLVPSIEISIGARLKDLSAFLTPSPNAYRPEDC